MTKIALLADCHISADGPGLDLLKRARELAGDVDRTIIAGDLVDTGSDAEYAAVLPVVGGGGCDVLPGNHEMIDGDMPRFHRHFERVPRETELGGVKTLLLNTALDDIPPERWYGRLCDGSRAMLRAAVDPASEEPLIVVVHHPFAGTVRAAPYPMMAQIGDEAERALLATHGGQVIVFSGHAHRPDLRRAERVTSIGLPPVCYWPHAFLKVTIDGGHLSYETVRVIADPADSPDPKVAGGERHLAAAEYRRDCEPVAPTLTLRL